MNALSKYLLISLLAITMIVAPLQAVGYAPPQPYHVLSRHGIIGPYVDHPLNTPLGFTADYKYSFTTVLRNYTFIIADGARSYIVTPGHPMLPVYTYKIEVNGYVPADKVHAYVYIEQVGVKYLVDPVVPAPQPLLYGLGNQTLRYIVDKEIYSTDKYYPGKLLDVNVWHGMHGKTIIIVRYYPAQYDPVTNTLFYIDKASVYIDYPSPIPVTYADKSLLILTTDKLVGNVTRLADFYKNKGYNVTIVTTSYIWKNYKPINNITQYPGFYNPLFNDTYYGIIAKTYNWTLALKIIDYLNKTLGEYSNLLIIGNASDIPPSFYYHYRIYDSYNDWVPTDFFYASPDLDLAPNIYVGRIPFSNPSIVEYVINKIIAWYDSEASSSRDLYMTGGYPFGQTLMFGESALSMMNMKGQLSMFRVHMLTRTSMNYDRNAVLKILSGDSGALWYFALCHGSGNALADRLLLQENGQTVMAFEILASISDLMSMKNNPSVPIVSSVACMNAAWDNNIPSPWFRPPSFGEAILMSPAGGIAYIGSARVAAELGVMFYLMDGIEYTFYYGATYLHYNILAAYSSLMGRTNETSLGYVVAQGITDYLASVPGTDPYVLGEVFKLTLLGDSNLILPVWSSPAEKTGISVARLGNYVSKLPAEITSYYARGYLPLYGISQKAWIYVVGGQNTATVTNVKLVNSYGFLYGLYVVNKTNIALPATGEYNYTMRFNDRVNGLVLVKFSLYGWGEVRVFLGAIGVLVQPSATGPGEPIIIKAYGMDLVGARTVNIYVAGRLLVQNLQLTYGSTSWRLALPYLAPGAYNVTVLPTSYVSPDVLTAVEPFMKARISIIGRNSLTITSNAPPVVETGRKVSIFLRTYYKGEPVEAMLKINVTGPTGTIKPGIKSLGNGAYIISFNATIPGRYTIYVEATRNNSFLFLRGYTSFSVVAVTSLYNGFQNIYGELHSLAYSVGENFTSLSTMLKTSVLDAIKTNGEEIKEVRSRLASIESVLADLKSGLRQVNTTLDKLVPTVETIKSNTGKIMSDIGSAKQAIMNGIASLGQNVTSLEDKLSTTTLYSEAGIALSAIVLAAVIVLGLVKKK